MVPDNVNALDWLPEQLYAEGSDLLREIVRTFAERLMAAEVEAIWNAGNGEVTPERLNSRNGYRRPRPLRPVFGSDSGQGHTTNDDPDSAAHWWVRAAAAGYSAAMYNLGVLRQRQGRLAEEDDDGAVHWYRRAADAGHSAARAKLNRLSAARVDSDRG